MKLKAVIMDKEKMEKTLNRLAHEIIEGCADLTETIIVGIRTRGVPMAKRLCDSIDKFTGIKMKSGVLDITLYRDDLSLISDHPVINSTDIAHNIHNKTIIFVDDVLYTGRTIRAAIEALMAIARPKCIKLAVMVDRGHRELPIRADFIGKNIPTAKNENVKVKFAEIDGEDVIELYEG